MLVNNRGFVCILVLYREFLFPFVELEAQIEQLRETQRKYSNILRLARSLTSHFYHVVQTQVIFLIHLFTNSVSY